MFCLWVTSFCKYIYLKDYFSSMFYKTTIAKHQKSYLCGVVLSFCSVPFIRWGILSLILLALNYCVFVVIFEICRASPITLIFFFKLSLVSDIFGPLYFHTNFKIWFQVPKNNKATICILILIAITLYVNLERVDTIPILNCPTPEQKRRNT